MDNQELSNQPSLFLNLISDTRFYQHFPYSPVPYIPRLLTYLTFIKIIHTCIFKFVLNSLAIYLFMSITLEFAK